MSVRTCILGLSTHWRTDMSIVSTVALSVAPGVVEAASDHIRTLTVRIRLINQQLKTAHCKLNELCAQLIPSEENEPGQQCEQRDVLTRQSRPGLEGSSSPCCSPRSGSLCAGEIIMPCA